MVPRVEAPEGQNLLLTVLVHRPENFDRLRRQKREEINKAIMTLDTDAFLLVNPFTSYSAKEECIRLHAKSLVGAASFLSKNDAIVLFPVNFEIDCPSGRTIPYEEDGLKGNLWVDYSPENTRAPRDINIKIDLGGDLGIKKIVVKNSIDPV